MTSWVVIDSGVYLAVGLKEAYAVQADQVIESHLKAAFQVAVPYLFRYEVVSTVCKHIARGSITLDDGRAALQKLLEQPVKTFANEIILNRAFDLATQFHRHAAYDSMYLALAEQLECEFWAADRKLYNVVGSTFSWVRWIGHYVPQAPP